MYQKYLLVTWNEMGKLSKCCASKDLEGGGQGKKFSLYRLESKWVLLEYTVGYL
jgi:hypothetical protein